MKALITLILVGTSSVAFARPILVDHRDNNMTFAPPAPDRQYYPQDYNQPLRFRLRPVTLAHHVSMMRQRNRDHRPLLIDIDSRMGTLKRLRFDRIEGRMHIEAIVVVLANGRTQTFEVNQVMSARDPSLTIDLDQRAITGIYVYGTTERGRGTFDVIGLRR